MTAGDQPGVERLIVVRGTGGRIMETLRGAGGVDGAFLEAHMTRMEFRPSRRRDVGARWWCWEYPEASKAPGSGAGWRSPRGHNQHGGPTGVWLGAEGGCWEHDRVSLCRASLWLAHNMSVLLINRPEASTADQTLQPPRPNLRHQDAATSTRAIHNGYDQLNNMSAAGAMTTDIADHCLAAETGAELETAVWDSIGEGLPYQELVAELIYERWTSFLENLGPKKPAGHYGYGGGGGRSEEALVWASIKALEQNLDTTRYLERQGRELDSLTYGDWSDLTDRATRRLKLMMKKESQSGGDGGGSDEEKRAREANKRSLDRIAYMGGLLAPLGTVSGIVSMNNVFGPFGAKHWLFWLISLAASALALVIIYIDQVRCLPVWIELAAAEALLDEAQRAAGVHYYYNGHDVVRDDGGRAWRRGQLGWGGAVKRITGYYRWSGTRAPQYDAPGRCPWDEGDHA
jgi:hypothetical protein